MNALRGKARRWISETQGVGSYLSLRRNGATLLSSGHAVSMVTATDGSLFSLAFWRIKKLSTLIVGRAEIGAFARSLNGSR